MSIRLAAIAALVVCTFAPRAVRADEGQLWEVTTHMDMSGAPEMQGHEMPPGMSDHTSQVCRGNDPREEITKNKRMKDCDVKDFKESGNTVTMKFECPKDGSGSMKIEYNKSKTSYTGTMKIHGRGHDMAMTMEGKKIGTCDAAKAKQERDERTAKMKAQSDMIKAKIAESNQMMESGEISNCEKSVEQMDPNGLGMYGQCYHKEDSANCKQILPVMEQQNPKIYKACSKSAAEFCKRFNTTEGFYKLGQAMRLNQAEEMCGVQADDLKPRLCKSAVKDEFWAFVGANCDEEAKPLAKKHCAGRSYTIKEGDPKAMDKKWYPFCVAVAGKNLTGEDTAKSEDSGSKGGSEEQPEDAKGVAKKAAKKAVVEGLKGLFGR